MIMPRYQKACKVLLIIAFVIFLAVTIYNAVFVYNGFSTAIEAKNNPPENGINPMGIAFPVFLVSILGFSVIGYPLATILCIINLVLLGKDKNALERKPFLRGILFNCLIIVGGIVVVVLSILLLSLAANIV